MPPPLIRRITIRNYKSIAACTVDLQQLMFVVGPNGAGKSNFLDAFRFVADALRTSLDHALRDRGTIKEVRRRSGGHPNSFALRFDFVLPTGQAGHYEFQVAARAAGGYEVQSESCQVEAAQALAPPQFYRIQAGNIVESSVATLPAVLPDRLLLVAASGLPEFRPVFDALSRMEIYNLNPREIAAMQRPDPGDILRRDGSNAASVLQQFPQAIQESDQRAYCPHSFPGYPLATPRSSRRPRKRSSSARSVRGPEHPWRFLAGSMSDGTLRAFGVLLAIFQAGFVPPGTIPAAVADRDRGAGAGVAPGRT